MPRRGGKGNTRMREPMESRKEQKRQSLLDAAYALFTEKGVAKTSVDEIVRGANVAKGTFYLYFHDKDQLLGQLVYNISAQVLEEAYEWLDERRTPDLWRTCCFFWIMWWNISSATSWSFGLLSGIFLGLWWQNR